MAEAAARPRRGGGGLGGFFRLTRMLHAYLSAFAFLALIFFSLTGLTLNHPEWLAGVRPAEHTSSVRLERDALARAMTSPDPTRALAAAVASRTYVPGAYASGVIEGGEALIRMEGPRGTADVTVKLATGEAEAAVRPASAIATFNDLHRGKAAGPVWRAVIDACAVLFLTLSVLGYVLFFSLRLRLPLSLVLTGASLVVLVVLAVLFVG